MSRANENDMRTFEWFEPAKRRASLYEDVTIDTQPSVHRHMDRGWLVSFEDGSGTWSDDTTAVKIEDWFAYRDPGASWERTFYQQGAAGERQIEAAVKQATGDRLFEDFSPEWIEFLRENLQVPAFVEHGLWYATATIARQALSDSLTHAIVLNAALKQRMAQSIVLYGLDLEPHFGPFPTETARQRWMETPAFQPTRKLLEAIHVTPDWMEVLVAANLCVEPLVGVLLRREFGMRAARVNGDTVTGVVAQVGQTEWEWIGNYTSAVVELAFGDATHGDSNRELVNGWMEKWLPQAREAAEALGGMATELPSSIDFEAAYERTIRDATTYHERVGVAGVTA